MKRFNDSETMTDEREKDSMFMIVSAIAGFAFALIYWFIFFDILK